MKCACQIITLHPLNLHRVAGHLYLVKLEEKTALLSDLLSSCPHDSPYHVCQGLTMEDSLSLAFWWSSWCRSKQRGQE